MGEPGVRYNVVWLREIWRIPLPRPLKFHLHRLPRPALPGWVAPRPRFARFGIAISNFFSADRLFP
jgi:hypothetical protein